MKKTALFIALFGFLFSAYAQEEAKTYKMFEIMYLTPRTDKLMELNEAMAKHNQAYHNEAPYTSHVWNIITGPHTGDLAWVMGPLTFTDLDSRPDTKEHTSDWIKNVMPFVKEVSDGEYWKMMDKLSYSPEGSFSGKEVWRVFDIKSFEEYRFTALLEQVSEVYRVKEYPNYFEVYKSQFRGGNGHDFAIGTSFKNYAFFDEDRKFWDDFEEVHGEDSRWKFMEEFRDVVNGSFEELSELIPELSGDAEKK